MKARGQSDSPVDGSAPTGQAFAALLEALRHVPQPMLIVRSDLAVDWQNEAAANLARRNLPVGVCDGRLRVRETVDRTRVKAVVRAACENQSVEDNDASSSIDLALSWPLRLLVVPLRGSVFQAPLSPLGAENGRALLFIEVAAVPPLPTADQLRNRFGLTVVEAAIAQELLRGDTPTDIAQTRQVSLNTVRTHVRRILEKSASSRISEFLAKIIGDPLWR